MVIGPAMLRPAFKIHGGKYYLCKWIIDHFPKNYETMDYLEPYAGAASVLMNKKRSRNELINDLDTGIISILRTIKYQCNTLVEALRFVEYTKETFEEALQKTIFTTDLDRTVNELILRRMSRGGLMKNFSWSDRLRGGQPGGVNAWKTFRSILPLISQRLQNVVISSTPALRLLHPGNAFENTLIYVDPPYLPITRKSLDTYGHEMSVTDHVELAMILHRCKAKILISGYPSPLYNELYGTWRRVEKRITNHSSQQRCKPVQTECLWLNY